MAKIMQFEIIPTGVYQEITVGRGFFGYGTFRIINESIEKLDLLIDNSDTFTVLPSTVDELPKASKWRVNKISVKTVSGNTAGNPVTIQLF